MNEDASKVATSLVSPTMIVTNEKGDTILAMKRKVEEDGYMHYLFEFYWDRVDPDRIADLIGYWQTWKSILAHLGIPLFDSKQIRERVLEYFSIAKTQNMPKDMDITIPVLDYATGEIFGLLVTVEFEFEPSAQR